MKENRTFELTDRIVRKFRLYDEPVVHIPDVCPKIGVGAFEGFDNLQLLSLADGVEVIADGAFENCKNLKAVYITKNSRLRYIGRRAFAGTNISNVMVPPDVEIDDNAFDDCPNLIGVLEIPRELMEDDEAEDIESESEYEDDSGGDDDNAENIIGDLIINLFLGG
ncbi:MAG: leucine-rich repeat domain-containing protein [Clostridiales bacterium]|nr:leucine-rich repeat domain-containing protein [Clostridiales bacterium]